MSLIHGVQRTAARAQYVKAMTTTTAVAAAAVALLGN